jgi:hypothetical protein
MDAITMLKDDHRTVEDLFKRFEKAGDRAWSLKRTLVDKMIAELSTHAAIEEELFYPATRATVPDIDDTVLEAIEEHHIVKWELSELEGLDPRAESFTAKVTVLIENVRHHVKEEEGDYFPKVHATLGRKSLGELGDAMAAAKPTAPVRPHPRAPSTPPANVAVNHAAGVVDRVEEKVSELASDGAAALRDVIERVGHSKKSSAPAGTSTKKALRTRADKAIEGTLETIRKVAHQGPEASAQVKKKVQEAAPLTEKAALPKKSARTKKSALTKESAPTKKTAPTKKSAPSKQAPARGPRAKAQ